jgi:glucose-1-phosphate cytidylyltransferase
MNSGANEFEHVPVVVLCGGRGVLVEGSGPSRVNKGLVRVAGKPLFSWVMLHYAQHGATDFILAAGLHEPEFQRALVADLGALALEDEPGLFTVRFAGHSCKVRVVATDPAAMTGDRLIACDPWLQQARRFCVTYSDTLSDVDLAAQLEFHRGSGLIATLVAAQLPVRFRVLGMRHDDPVVRAFSSRPVIEAAPINGGYYVFETAVLAYLHEAAVPRLVLEREILERLARESQLAAFTHRGAWQHFDCERDLDGLTAVAERLQARK